MMRTTIIARHLIAPLVLCALAFGFVARVAMRAAQVDPLPVASKTNVETSIRPATSTSERADITPAVELDPFRPDRTRPAVRYGESGDEDSSAEATPEPTPSEVKLLGTVTAPDGGSFAMVAVAGAAPRVVRVGQVVGDLTLKAVERGKAVFRSAAGEVVELSVPKAGQ